MNDKKLNSIIHYALSNDVMISNNELCSYEQFPLHHQQNSIIEMY